MTQRPDTDNYRQLLLSDTPMMDMRSPGEFTQGAFPCAHSLPLMSDDERAEVGSCYKQQGQGAAIELGHELVSGEIREQRLQAWSEFAQANPSGYLYCFRGGLRSQTVQAWLKAQGIAYPLVLGGYKAMRRFLIDELERSVERADIVLISGKTGTGKTRVIDQLSNRVDLEGLANHRGSTFGQLPSAQPSQINFENQLSIELMRCLDSTSRYLYLEDEGRLIGRCYIPDVLTEKMSAAPMLVVEQSLAERVKVVIADYVVDLGERYADLYGREEGAMQHANKLQADLLRIRKRLGGELQQRVSVMMNEAFTLQWQTGELAGHGAWIEILLADYYDPMYEYQLSRRGGQRLFSGDREAVAAWTEQV